MIILDFEWNRGYDKRQLDEILQIGAIRVTRLGGPMVDSFSVYIKPAIHKKFDPGARALPDLNDSLRSNLNFPAALARFRNWCGEETVFAAWGGGDDFKALERNCAYWKLPRFSMEKTYNIQLAFSALVGTAQQVALHRAVEYCGIPDVFVFHNALYDAMYTAILCEWLTPESLQAQNILQQPRDPRFSPWAFPRQARQRLGPFAGSNAALNDSDSRKPTCPVCGKSAHVTHWRFAQSRHSLQPQQYFSAFICPKHGRFLCRLTLAQREDGSWVARRSVPNITPEVSQAYEIALQGSTYFCNPPASKRRRKKGGLRMNQ
ncbi:MAG: exonuclease domain-containing protein [Oscillibacter sp.]|nr:exonuclease domain-containing protein [Oscillibacter sp.]